MKAVYITEHGGSDVLTYGDLPEPSVGPTDVLVRVRACSVNRLDVYTRAGVRGTRRRLDEPYVLGGDASGDVVEVGEEVSSIRPGDRVVLNPSLSCGQCHRCAGDEEELCTEVSGAGGYGGYAEMVAAPARSAVLLPDSVSYVQAASLPTVFLPCWTILIRRGALKATETALVLSASSGVGTAGIQVAKSVVGARVITTTSTEEKARKARELGADEVINYNEEDIADARGGPDRRPRRRRGAGPRGQRLLARGHILIGRRRALRRVRGDDGVPGGPPVGNSVPEEPDRVRSLHGPHRRAA